MKLQDLFESQIEYVVSQKILKDIKKKAMDPAVPVERAIDLVHQVYRENGVNIPTNMMKKPYKQYLEHCVQAVKALNTATQKGARDDSWKFTPDKTPIT